MAHTPPDWLKLTLHHPPITAEAVSALLFDEGAQGLWENQPDQQGRLVTLAGFALENQNSLTQNLPEIIARLAEAFELKPEDFEYSLNLEQNHDWAEKWKEGLTPIVVSQTLAIAPTWWPNDDLPNREIVLRLDPGLAFGSGHHATTFMCLAFLSQLAPTARRILDVGAGSGILSLACAALSPQAEIIGVDNDPETIIVAQDNAALNNLAQRLAFSHQTLAQLSPPFDLIVANITSNPLMELAPAISRLANEQTKLILSGLPESQAPEVYQVYTSLGWQTQENSKRDGWEAQVLVR